ncbi:MAG: type II secretion system minor pseudopilin GspI [Chromatiales bacterium]|nr:type II secretion system minor pseudopilin GspI [Chromatiales bacterium]
MHVAQALTSPAAPAAPAGFTLIEVLAALVIVALGMLGVIQAVTQTARNGTYLREKTLAHWIAHERDHRAAPAWRAAADVAESSERRRVRGPALALDDEGHADRRWPACAAWTSRCGRPRRPTAYRARHGDGLLRHGDRRRRRRRGCRGQTARRAAPGGRRRRGRHG